MYELVLSKHQDVEARLTCCRLPAKVCRIRDCGNAHQGALRRTCRRDAFTWPGACSACGVRDTLLPCSSSLACRLVPFRPGFPSAASILPSRVCPRISSNITWFFLSRHLQGVTSLLSLWSLSHLTSDLVVCCGYGRRKCMVEGFMRSIIIVKNG